MSSGNSKKRRPSRHPAGRKADWTAWSLHLIFGLIVGAAIGVLIAFRLEEAGLLLPGNLIRTTIGISLIIAAAASHRGDRLWMWRSHLDMPEYPRSRASAFVSLLVGSAGTVLVMLSFLSSLSRRAHDEIGSITITDAPLMLAAAMLISLCIYGWRTGTVIGINFYFHHHETPFLYWLFLSLQAIGAIGALLAILT